MTLGRKLCLLLALAASSFSTQAAEPPFTLPPAMFFSTLDNSLLESLKKNALFSELNDELYGSPIRLGVIHTIAATAGGTASEATSLVLSAGTLGLLPIVSNNDLVVTYTLSAHSKKVVSFSYSKNFTQASSLYSEASWSKMDSTVKAWILSTADTFVADLSNSAEARELTREYEFYFAKRE